MAFVTRNFLTRSVLTQLTVEAQVGLWQQDIERRQAGKQQFHVIHLERLVRSIAQFTLQSDTAGFEQGVEAHAEQVNVFRIFGEE